MTFSQYGITAFDVQYWDGSVWITVPNGAVVGNSNVRREITFPSVTTTKVRVVVNDALAGYSRITELEVWGGVVGLPPTPSPTPSPTPGTRINVALAAGGAVASASSSYNDNYPVASVNNGDRAGQNWGAGGGWNDATSGSYPDWVEVAFSAPRTIDEIGVFTVQDAYWDPAEPSETQVFSQYGITSFDVQYWNGSVWVTVPAGVISNSNKVWTRLTFPAVQTSKVRVVVNSSLNGYSRITELEAWGK
jgi:hypothetical protein